MYENLLIKKQELENHDFLINNYLKNIEDIKKFMESHVFCVFDFMSLAKSLQNTIVPSSDLWIPNDLNHSESARLINEIITGEETDEDNNGGYCSHFALYLKGMEEIGANTSIIKEFINILNKTKNIDEALKYEKIPPEAKEFMEGTFSFIKSKKPYNVAAAFTYGRETVIPSMFLKILEQLNLNKNNIPTLIFYLERHIFLDGEEHGPASLKLVKNLVNNLDEEKEAIESAIKAIEYRIKFWDSLKNKFL